MEAVPSSASHLPEMFFRSVACHGERPAFASRRPDGSYQPYTYAEVKEMVVALAEALLDLGVSPRQQVGLLADNRLEWILSDLAILCCGAADVPRGTDVTNREMEYILNHADVEVCFVENVRLAERLRSCRAMIPGLRAIIVMDMAAPAGDFLLLSDLIETGRRLREEGSRQCEKTMEAIRPGDLFTLIYTSGTTGTPKGVMLTHANMMSQLRNIPIPIYPTDRMLSILPVWHSYERVFQMIAICFGCCTHYTSIRTIADDLKTVQPTLMASAPRLWESLYLKILQKVQKAPAVRRALFHAAVYCSRQVLGSLSFLRGQALDTTGRPLAVSILRGGWHSLLLILFFLPHVLLNQIVLKKIRANLGGCLRATVSGGGALQRHVDEFFNYIGVPVLEGYGLTETCPVLAVRTRKKLVIGTVGILFRETELRIVDLQTGEILFPNSAQRAGGRGLRGEIHVRGPQVMKGYYKEPEATARVLHGGWLNTGDLGMYTFNDCLKIMGRSKDTIVLLSGENVEPVPIENRLCQSELIDQCIVVGQDEKQLGALIVPSLDGCAAISAAADTLEEISRHETVRHRIGTEVKRLINEESGFKKFEQIHAFRLLPKAFEVGDEMTNTFKLKRHVIHAKYKDLVDAMYSGGGVKGRRGN